MKLTAKNAIDVKTPANSTSRRPESDGRRPGPGVGHKSETKQKVQFYFAYPNNPGLAQT